MRRSQAKRRPQPAEHDLLMEQLAWLMDECIQIGPISIGLDGFLGLIPGFGDMAGAVVSAVIISRAMMSGIPKSAIIRMVINVGLDSLLGSVPLVGDVFDFAFKANVKNIEIYRTALTRERRVLGDWAFNLLIFILLLALIALPIAGLIYVVRFLQAHLPL